MLEPFLGCSDNEEMCFFSLVFEEPPVLSCSWVNIEFTGTCERITDSILLTKALYSIATAMRKETTEARHKKERHLNLKEEVVAEAMGCKNAHIC